MKTCPKCNKYLKKKGSIDSETYTYWGTEDVPIYDNSGNKIGYFQQGAERIGRRYCYKYVCPKCGYTREIWRS